MRPEKNVTNDFRIKFLLCFRSRKNDSVNGMPENLASRRILTKMAASVFYRTLSWTGSILSNTDLSDMSTVGTCDIFVYQTRYRVM